MLVMSVRFQFLSSCPELVLSQMIVVHAISGAQWLSGRVLDSSPRGRGFEPHPRHCIVVLEQDTFILAKYWYTQENPSLLNWKIVDGT